MKPEKILPKRISRALEEYELIAEGDRVILALSGGKDSLAMAWFMGRMASCWIRPFTVEAVHVRAPWEGEALADGIGQICADWALPYREIPLLQTDLKEPEEMCCSHCARLRRQALLSYASREGFQSLALGHHMEDCLETFLMNMVYQSRLDPLPPRRDYPGIKLIRPLILAQEETVARWALEKGLNLPEANCPWESVDSRRKEMRAHLEAITDGSAAKKLNMFRAALALV
ncbi:MAG: ATP-binding protein [Spirochaetales bacterium]|nr:ATP-binding protein [Spirochaetales bacterium]